MKRPDFLTTPEAWTRASRTTTDRAAYGCAIERSQQLKRQGLLADWLVIVVAVVALTGAFMGVL